MTVRSKAGAWLCAAAALSAGTANAALLWGMDLNTDNLITVDTASGTVTIIGNLPGSGTFGGLDFDSSGQLYVLKTGQGLFRVNAGDATGVLVGTQPGRAFESLEIIGNRGYSADVFNNLLYEIDLATGAATAIGSYGNTRITGLASSGGVMYGLRIFQNDLVEVDEATGASSLIGVHGLGNATSLAFADGLLWTIPVGTNDLYSLNPATAAATLVNGNLLNVPHITGLTAREAAVVPEPGVLLLLSAALGALAWRSRGRRGIDA